MVLNFALFQGIVISFADRREREESVKFKLDWQEAVGLVLKYAWVGVLMGSIAIESFTDRSWINAYLAFDWRLMIVEMVVLSIAVGSVYLLYLVDPELMTFGIVKVIKWILGREVSHRLEDSGGNASLIGVEVKYLGVIVCVLLLTALPRWAALEEQWFRLGTVDWRDGIIRSIIFGFAHMLIGVPVFGALVLTLLGVHLTHLYFLGGVELSTQAHFQYNMALVSLLLLGAIAKSLSKD